MTLAAGHRSEAPAGVDSFLRQARTQLRGRASRTDRFINAYTSLFITAVLVAWAVAGVSGLGSSLGSLVEAAVPGGALYRAGAAWLGSGAPVLGASALLAVAWVGAADLLRGLGPVGMAPERALWVWPLPGAGALEPIRSVRRMMWGASVAGTLLGGMVLLLLWGSALAGGWAASWWQAAAHVVCWVGLCIGAVGVSVCAQATAATRRSSSCRPWLGWAMACGVVLVLAAGVLDAGPDLWGPVALGLPTSWPLTVLLLPPGPAVGLAVLSAVLAGILWAAALRWGRALDGEQLRAAGSRTRHLNNAVSLMSAQDLHAALTPAAGIAVRPLPGTSPGWVRGPRTVVLLASLTAQMTSRWRAGLVVDLGVSVMVLASFVETVVLAGWVVLLVVGYRGLGRGTAYLADLRAGSAAERSLPIGPTAAALVHLLLPCALNAVVLAAVATLAALAAGAASLSMLLLGAVAGAGIGAVAAYRILAPEADHTQPPIDTPLGPVPVAQLISYSRGMVLILALLAAPAAVLLHGAAWPPAVATAVALMSTAVVLAVRTDLKR